MKNIYRIAGALGLLVLVAPPAVFAAKADGPKAKMMEKYDLNHDGKLDADEITAIQKAFAADPKGDLKRFDTNHDGKLSDEEIAKMVPSSGKKSGAEKKGGGKKKADAEKHQ